MPASTFFFHTLDISYRIREKGRIRSWLKAVFESEDSTPGEVNFILCSDAYLYDMNVSWLNHDTLTDVIAFDFSEAGKVKGPVSGDIYISIDRVRENAGDFKVSVRQELLRVMLHGVLHLLGYRDKQPAQQRIMRRKEDFYLSLPLMSTP